MNQISRSITPKPDNATNYSLAIRPDDVCCATLTLAFIRLPYHMCVAANIACLLTECFMYSDSGIGDGQNRTGKFDC